MSFCAKFCTVFVVILAIAIGVAYRSSRIILQQEIPVEDGGKYFKLKDGRTLEYFEFGSPSSNKTGVFIHGFMTTGNIFSTIDRAAKANDLRVIAPTLPGWGFSDYNENNTYLSSVADIVQLMDSLKIDKFSVLGVSFGGPHAAVFGAAYPDRVVKTVLVIPMCSLSLPNAYQNKHPVEVAFRNILNLPVIRDLFAAYLVRYHVSNDVRQFFMVFSPEEYKQFFSIPKKMLDVLFDDMKRSMTLSSVGYADGLGLLSQLLDFDVSKAASNGREVVLYTANEDELATEAQIACYSQIPGVEVKTWQASHFTALLLMHEAVKSSVY